jgi:hypothetical protein
MDGNQALFHESNPASVEDAFCIFYGRLCTSVQEAITGHADYVVLSRLMDDLMEYRNMVESVHTLTGTIT